MSPEEEVVRGGQAREVLDSEIFNEAKENVLSAIKSAMDKVPMADNVMHTRLILMYQLWNKLESYLAEVAQTGKIAQFQIDAEEKRKRWSVVGR